jgi:hypothetical protein
VGMSVNSECMCMCLHVCACMCLYLQVSACMGMYGQDSAWCMLWRAGH